MGSVRAIEILRKVLNHDEGYLPQRVDLHGFGDVSQQRHGAWIYLKSIFNRASAFAHLLTSKSRLAPIKESAIPRLELLDNLILRGSLHGRTHFGLLRNLLYCLQTKSGVKFHPSRKDGDAISTRGQISCF